ncbi:MAG: type II toxin-antitoxin system ParD family antitoxin [Alphaproteobacteria bacterium]|nr:type II toxin-antitoxin system ParD family antitoxin [Alphaproteobacteria bacterium]
MPTRNIVLTQRQADLVERLVSSGRYQNASEVLRAGLCLIEAKAAEDEARLQALREAVRAGIADIEAGRFVTFGSRTELRDHLNAIADDAIAEGAKRGKRIA